MDVLAQSNTPSLFAGFSAVAVNVREIDQYTSLTQRPETFKGGGVTIGAGLEIRKHLFVEISVTPFKGNQLTRVTFSTENYFETKGVQVPLSVNRLFDVSRKFRMSFGGGFNLLKANVKQYDDKGGKMLSNTSFFTPNLAVFTSFRWRLSQRVGFNINLNVSMVPRFAGTIGFALQYSFRKKEEITSQGSPSLSFLLSRKRSPVQDRRRSSA